MERFRTACVSEDLQGLLAVLTDEAVLYGDGGGRVQTAPAPIHSAEAIARFLVGIRERAFADAELALSRST